MERIRKHSSFLNKLVKSKQKRKSIREASKGEICTVCEVVMNIVHNPSLNLKPTPRERQVLNNNISALRKLIDKRTPVHKKKEILQKGSGVIIPLIAALAGPILNRLLK